MIRHYRYYPWKFPGYWLVVFFAAYMSAALAGPNANHEAIALVVSTALIALRWKSFLRFGQTAMLVSPSRIYIRGITGRYGVRRKDCIVSAIFPYGARYMFDVWEFKSLDSDTRTKYFFADNFDFLSFYLDKFSSSRFR